MECGASDFWCYLLKLLARYGVELAGVLNWFPWFQEKFIQNFQTVVGICGFSFGVYRWWYFRERVLHKRLKKYLREQDARLIDARTYVIDALYRPGSKRTFAEPLFSVPALRRVLRRRKWEGILTVGKIETGADRLLNKAILQIECRLETSDDRIRSYRHQQAAAHVLKGAIAAARAPRAIHSDERVRLDRVALDEFRTAQQVVGHDRDAETKMYEAHQLRRLGYLLEAEEAYKAARAFADSEESLRAKTLTIGRSKYWQAVIQQAKAVQRYNSQKQETAGSMNANLLISDALSLRSEYAPYLGWDALEQGDYHYYSAYVYRNLGANAQEPNQLGKAATEYQRVMTDISLARWMTSSSRRRLYSAAAAGAERVKKARNGNYDEEWLLPPLQKAKQPASGVG